MTFFQPGQQAYALNVGTTKTANNVIYQRDPSADDVLYAIGTFWQNIALEKMWYLNSFTSVNGLLQAQWVLISVSSLLVSLSGSATPSDAVFPTTSTGVPLPDNIQLTNLDGSMTITSDPTNNRVIFTAISTPLPFPWTDKAASSPILEVNNGYFCIAALTATLPLSPAQGEVVLIAVDTSSPVVVQASSGQIIRLGSTTTMVAGMAVSTASGCSLELVFRAANSEWFAVSSSGSWALA